jgi:hypothetical protein
MKYTPAGKLTLVDLIPLPLLPREKGSNMHIINGLAPLPWERGWGEVKKREVEVGRMPPGGFG